MNHKFESQLYWERRLTFIWSSRNYVFYLNICRFFPDTKVKRGSAESSKVKPGNQL